MQYRTLGHTGIRVSRVTIGTMTFGKQLSEIDSEKAVHVAMDCGINFIDTANVYTKGISETIIGKALKKQRDKVILASKCGLGMSDVVNDSGLSRSTIIRHVNASLRRLNTDYLDILYLHLPDYSVAREDIVETMSLLISDGKIRHYGLSNFPAWLCCSIFYTAKEMGCPPPVVTENVYNMITRGIDDELLPFVAEFGLGLVTYNPLAGGLLTGKYANGHIAEGSRFAIDIGYANRYCKKSNNEAADKITSLANSIGITSIELTYQWLLSKDFITSIICGFSSISQLKDNLSACDEMIIPPEIFKKCDDFWNQFKGDYFNYHY